MYACTHACVSTKPPHAAPFAYPPCHVGQALTSRHLGSIGLAVRSVRWPCSSAPCRQGWDMICPSSVGTVHASWAALPGLLRKGSPPLRSYCPADGAPPALRDAIFPPPRPAYCLQGQASSVEWHPPDPESCTQTGCGRFIKCTPKLLQTCANAKQLLPVHSLCQAVACQIELNQVNAVFKAAQLGNACIAQKTHQV